MKTTFDSDYNVIDKIDGVRDITEIADEPSFFSCSPQFVRDNGGPLHQDILNALESNETYLSLLEISGLNILVDSRVTQTMTGMYPAIPGWHCDNVPRSKYGKPDVNAVDSRVQHFMCYLSSCLEHTDTEFVNDLLTLDLDLSNPWHSLDSYLTEHSEYNTTSCSPGELVNFNQLAIHRATPTLNPGWRLWLRVSLVDRPVLNKIRKQVQVYTSINGW